MVTAIAIPLLFVYFYYVTRKEQKRMYHQWLQVGNVPAESVVKGTIIAIQEKTERYYGHYLLAIIDLQLEHGKEKIMARMQFPLTESLQKPTFSIGDTMVCYGRWGNQVFLFTTYQTVATASKNLAYNIEKQHLPQDE
ncbi:hypothetical protein GFC30_1392 [Anoxybacillus amylolyticus]|uniref:Uncharacterized protein n=2 Tax=Anoxybacteroides amylolyticum TaxID=294699 RepID=A0A160F6D0_9BACL|nr:hypothetical protein GFC30_1392 [Anoxybacillus amylolyticus]